MAHLSHTASRDDSYEPLFTPGSRNVSDAIARKSFELQPRRANPYGKLSSAEAQSLQALREQREQNESGAVLWLVCPFILTRGARGGFEQGTRR
ncbi:hypothetical protein [Bradyrhizobium sp. Ghvi]|uniref:hypothetical protein n=1 Tax=Bradyrhizobium sp. Ghvi TaxID=1855319 RepID=UPI0011789B0A|nr:hypothetical protein [Bradyrhizobium sp. Ghvi]